MDETPGQPSSPSSEAQFEIDSRQEEAQSVLAAGPRSGNRAGAFAFLALIVIIAAAVYFHFAGRGVDSFQNRLDSQLLNHAELSMHAMTSEAPIAVVPSWPHTLYHALRQDIVMYAAFAALAAYCWSRAAAARARRDAFILYDGLNAEIARLRERVAKLDGGSAEKTEPCSPHPDTTETKG